MNEDYYPEDMVAAEDDTNYLHELYAFEAREAEMEAAQRRRWSERLALESETVLALVLCRLARRGTVITREDIERADWRNQPVPF